MTATTPTHLAEFTRYLQRTMPELPEAIREGMPPPTTWTGTPQDWEEVTALARASYRYEAARKFCLAVADGWYPIELAEGQLARGSRLDVAGRVVRPLPSTVNRDLEEAAGQALDQMQYLNVSIDAVIAANLEHAAIGAWRGHPRAIEDALGVAKTALAARRAEIEAAANRRRTKMSLRVHGPFRAIGGRVYGAGESRIDPEEADELREWRTRMEAQAASHGWDAPVGYTPEAWPPFEIAK